MVSLHFFETHERGNVEGKERKVYSWRATNRRDRGQTDSEDAVSFCCSRNCHCTTFSWSSSHDWWCADGLCNSFCGCIDTTGKMTYFASDCARGFEWDYMYTVRFDGRLAGHQHVQGVLGYSPEWILPDPAWQVSKVRISAHDDGVYPRRLEHFGGLLL